LTGTCPKLYRCFVLTDQVTGAEGASDGDEFFAHKVQADDLKRLAWIARMQWEAENCAKIVHSSVFLHNLERERFFERMTARQLAGRDSKLDRTPATA
jgi:hypothetical protein